MRVLLLLCLAAAPGLAAAPLPAGAAAQPAAAWPDPWWEGLALPGLGGVIDAVLRGNGDLSASTASARLARAAADRTRSVLLPALSVEGSGSVSPTDAIGFGLGLSGLPIEGDTWQSASLMLSAGLQLDLFGRSVALWGASRHDARAAAGDRDALALALAARAAGAWVEFVAAREQERVVRAQVATSRAMAEAIEARFAAGLADVLDLLQQRQQLAAVEAMLPQAEAAVAVQERVLAGLAGLGTSRPSWLAAAPGRLPPPPAGPAAPGPGTILARRPDLAAAQARAEAAEQRVRAARRAFLPVVTLAGQAGRQATRFDAWDTLDTWTASGAVSLPLFAGGANLAALREAEAAAEAARRARDQALSTALADAAVARARTDAALGALASAERGRAAAEAAWSAARDRYVAGEADVLVALRTLDAWQQAERQEVLARRDAWLALVDLLDAMGGHPPSGGTR